ncbi:hypothetical protein COR50_00300 [Chitinophaga caeni]|uniref:Uncharacterized protein n=1 Tax=Chitinophaga caeni TaxID=2029983 RepID=A0A291QPB2_9BACT|nr:hypothetical protein [Chitinophaga caeni]ATL45722.1 hypothetical protein COR50_00300 [Chitinophaga caeni]
MTGDKYNIRVSSWWNSASSPGTDVSPLNDILSVLVSGVPGASGGKVAGSELTGALLGPSVTSFLATSNGGASGKPKAYLTGCCWMNNLN